MALILIRVCRFIYRFQQEKPGMITNLEKVSCSLSTDCRFFCTRQPRRTEGKAGAGISESTSELKMFLFLRSSTTAFHAERHAIFTSTHEH